MILDTREYARFCQKAFGRMLHHVPDAYGTDDFRKGWAKTTELVAKHFGIFLHKDPDALTSGSPKQWNMAAFCSRAPLEPGEDFEDPLVKLAVVG
jgi:hypothetical protein